MFKWLYKLLKKLKNVIDQILFVFHPKKGTKYPKTKEFPVTGAMLEKLRTDAALTQSKLSLDLGVSRGMISKYENHSAIPSIEVMRKYDTIFGTEYSDAFENIKYVDIYNDTYFKDNKCNIPYFSYASKLVPMYLNPNSTFTVYELPVPTKYEIIDINLHVKDLVGNWHSVDDKHMQKMIDLQYEIACNPKLNVIVGISEIFNKDFLISTENYNIAKLFNFGTMTTPKLMLRLRVFVNDITK